MLGVQKMAGRTDGSVASLGCSWTPTTMAGGARTPKGRGDGLADVGIYMGLPNKQL
jgi:hypothetical protein